MGYITVAPAKAGVHIAKCKRYKNVDDDSGHWIPAFAGMTAMVQRNDGDGAISLGRRAVALQSRWFSFVGANNYSPLPAF